MASPTLPQLTVDTTDPLASIERTVDCSSTNGSLTTSTLRKNALLAAITDAKFKDYIITEPNETYDTNLNLIVPATSGLGATSGYVVIRPRGFDAACPIGERVFDTDTAAMTTLRSATVSGSTSDPVITVSAGAKYWWVSGLHLIPKAATFSGNIVLFSLSAGQENPANQTSYMTLDRCYVHGDTSGTNGGPGCQRGVLLNGSYQAVINNTIDDIKTTDNQGDSQAISMAYGPGPIHIENNLLGATSENIIFETTTGERILNCVYTGNATSIYTTSATILYDAVGKSINLAGTPGTTATISSIQANTPDPGKTTLQLSGALSATDFSGTAYIAYNHAASFFPADITIKRNHFRKKDAWRISHASFERTSGSETFGAGPFDLTIDATNSNQATNSPTAFTTDHIGRYMYVTTNTGGWVPGYAYITACDDVTHIATFNRVLGTVGSTGGGATLQYSVKNLLEFKSGSRILVEGNVLDGSWPGGQNFALTFTPRWCNSPPGDLTFRSNVVQNTFGIFAISASDGVADSGTPGPFLEQHRVHMHDNLFENIRCSPSSPYATPASNTYFYAQWFVFDDVGTLNGVASGAKTMDDFVFENNTIAGVDSEVHRGIINLNGYSVEANIVEGKRFIFRNNVVFSGNIGHADSYGVFKANSGSGTAGLDAVTVNSGGDARIVAKNIFFDTDYTASDLSGGTETGNVAVTLANRSTINFTDYTNGDYSIASGTYNNWGTDGTDPGYDKGETDTKISGAITGVWPASPFRYLPIRWP